MGLGPGRSGVRPHVHGGAESAMAFSLALFQDKYAESLAFVSPATFRRWWLATVILHAWWAMYLCFVARIYLFLPTQPVLWFLQLYAVVTDTVYFPLIAASYMAIALVHVTMLVSILKTSVHQRRPVFRSPPVVVPPVASRDGSTIELEFTPRRRLDAAARKCARWLPAWVLRAGRKVLGVLSTVREANDIRSNNYGVAWVALKTGKTLVQTYQAFRLSMLVPRLWLSNVVVGLIVLNCWLPALLRRVSNASVADTRLYELTLSLALDFVAYCIIPVIVFTPYREQFDFTAGDFGDEYWYNDVWLVRMINELQLLFVVSGFDALSKATIALSVPRSLHVLTKLLRERPATLSALSVRHLARVSRRHGTIVPDGKSGKLSLLVPSSSFRRIKPSLTPSSPSHLTLPTELRHGGTFLRRSVNSHRIERLGHRFLQLWGLTVLATHLHATVKAPAPYCALHAYPWFVSQSTCSLLELDCASNSDLDGGSAAAIAAILDAVDAAHVQHVVIRNCPVLTFPPHIQHLHHLVGLKIRSSTIVEWGVNAALTHASHPELRFLFMGDINVATLPDGVLARNFPRRLRDIEICRVNITHLPDNLDQVWPTGMFLLLEELQLTEFPGVVLRMQPRLLSLAFNNLSTVPPSLFELPSIETLILNGNPIVTLQPNLTLESDALLELDLVATKVEELPVWLETGAKRLINAAHSPMCDKLQSEGIAPPSRVDCENDERLTWYPINRP